MFTPLSFPGPPRGTLPLPTGASGDHLFGYTFHSHCHSGFLASRLQNSFPAWAPTLWKESPIPRGLQDSHPTWIQARVATLLPYGDPTRLPRRLAARRPRDLQARLAHRGACATAICRAFRLVIPATTACGPCFRATPECHTDQTGAG